MGRAYGSSVWEERIDNSVRVDVASADEVI